MQPNNVLAMLGEAYPDTYSSVTKQLRVKWSLIQTKLWLANHDNAPIESATMLSQGLNAVLGEIQQTDFIGQSAVDAGLLLQQTAAIVLQNARTSDVQVPVAQMLKISDPQWWEKLAEKLQTILSGDA